MRITFLRHGHAAHNQGKDEHGDVAYTWEIYRDALLTEKGRRQARAVSLPVKPDRVYSSPLRRCIQTVREFLPEMRIYLHDGLIERQCDHPCNKRSSIETIADSSHNLDTSRLCSNPSHAHEDEHTVHKRFQSALYEIVKESEVAGAEHILIVTHWDLLRIVFQRKLDNCETMALQNIVLNDILSSHSTPNKGFLETLI
jgi:broad specificity phosphatase PhoE